MGSGVSTPRGTPKKDDPSKKAFGNFLNESHLEHSVVSPRINSATLPKVRAGSTMDTDEARDVMISYSHSDKEMMSKIKDSLEENGISVWVDKTGLQPGVDFLGKIGQAIIDAKVFISLLSERTINSKFCRDELALAYVTSKPIFPVGLQTELELFPIMDTGMKLQLARFTWTLFTEPDRYEENVQKLLRNIRQEIDTQVKSLGDTEEPTQEKKPPKLERMSSRHALYSRQNTTNRDAEENTLEELSAFWENHFKDEEEVQWDRFSAIFSDAYKDQLSKVCSNDEDTVWLIDVLRREMEVTEDGNILYKDKYLDFCTIGGELLPLWERVKEQALESYTMKQVFDMNSSVRVQTIENLGKFNSPAVRDALLDLLTDKDLNVRAIAAISLAKTGANDKLVIKKLMKCLESKDRLVRESGCLALGHLQAELAVPKLLQLWRNDTISHVREAAFTALGNIGGEEADKAVHMTKVLSEEIRMLTHK